MRLKWTYSRAVYHLHGQTGRFTVWTNGKQNSGLVNFVPETRLPSFTEKRPRRRETGMKMSLKKWNTNFRLVHPEKQDHLFRCSVAPGNFPLERPKKSCSTYFPNGFCGNFGNGKQPRNIPTVIWTKTNAEMNKSVLVLSLRLDTITFLEKNVHSFTVNFSPLQQANIFVHFVICGQR